MLPRDRTNQPAYVWLRINPSRNRLTCEKLPRATTLIKEEIEEETGRISFGNRFKFQQNGGTQVLCFQTGAANPKTVMDSMGHSDLRRPSAILMAFQRTRREAVERATQAFCGIPRRHWKLSLKHQPNSWRGRRDSNPRPLP